MTARAGASRAEALDDAIKQHLQITDGARESFAAHEALDAVLNSADSLKAKWRAATEMGGEAPTLTLEDTRLIRSLLADAINHANCESDHPTHSAGPPIDVRLCVDLRKRINASIVRNGEKRCGQDRAEEFRALRAAEAVADSDETEGDAA